MKRLTERDKNGTAMAVCCGENCKHNFCCENGDFAECGDMDDIIDRLAAIEDILGDEYELDRMRGLVEADRLRAENEQLREQVRQLETRARTERCDAADYDCRELGVLRREVAELRERLAAGEWIDPAVALPPNDDMVLAIVSGKPASNITLVDVYVLAAYGSEGWIVEQYELWETPVVSWWRPLPDPPKKEAG